MIDKIRSKDFTICVVGLGYVGLHLFMAFARNGFRVIGYDIDQNKIENLRKGRDITREYSDEEVREILEKNVEFTSEPTSIGKADTVHMCVPTLLKNRSEPDLGHIESASRTIGRNLMKGSIVVNESSVYPGATEEVIKPILEKESGLVCGRDFMLGYSPERVNPGDKDHDLGKVVKVISGMDDETMNILAELYGNIVPAGVFRAKSIKTAEMSKLMENIQRDLNISMMNEFSIICRKMGISIGDVIDAAKTKWNFCEYMPGLVGGYCVPVNPIYLLHKSRELGYDPKVIAAGRELNDSMPDYLFEMIEEGLGGSVRGRKVLIMGLGFKKNIKDPRESPSKRLIERLAEEGAELFCYDPMLSREAVKREFGIEPIVNLEGLSGIECIAVLVGHDAFKEILPEKLEAISGDKPLLIDVQSVFEIDKFNKSKILYYKL